MLTYRTGAAGAPSAARFMSEHLLQQTLPPRKWKRLRITTSRVRRHHTVGEAAASRYAYVAAGGVPLSGERLDGIVRDELCGLLKVHSAPTAQCSPPMKASLCARLLH